MQSSRRFGSVLISRAVAKSFHDPRDGNDEVAHEQKHENPDYCYGDENAYPLGQRRWWKIG
jgi:hypothetical protein